MGPAERLEKNPANIGSHSRNRPRSAAVGGALLAGAVACALLWWRFEAAPGDELPPDWTAAALVLAGDGIAGTRDGDAAAARFADPFGVAIAGDGTVYVSDGAGADRIRRISPEGRVSTLAGSDHGYADGAGEAARFSTPSGLALDASGTLYVADTGNNVIRRITRDGDVSTLAGDGVAGASDGPAHAARFNGPIGVAVAPGGRIIVADTYNDRIRAIDPDGTVSTLAPGARFHTPSGVAADSSGNVYVADTGNGLVRVIDRSGFVTNAQSPFDGLFHPIGIAAGQAGEVYATDERGRIVEIRTDGSARTLAGSAPGFRDGAGRQALFRNPTGIAWASPGRLIVADAGNALVRLVAASSRLELRLPPSPRIAPQFDAARFGWQPLLWPVAPFDGPHEIAGTLGEARGSEGAERLHGGIDVRIEQGTPVHAVRDGVVTGPVSTDAFGTLNEWLRIGPIGYVHIRAGRGRRNDMVDRERFVPAFERGRLVGLRVKRGARFTTGDVIGSVNAFNHVHLNVGWPGEEHNPLGFGLVQFEDTIAPTIPPGGVLLYDEEGRPLSRRFAGRIVVEGRVQIVVDAWDQADGNLPQRRLGLYDLGYQVLNRDGSPAAGFETVRRTQLFDRFGQDPGVAALVYAPGSGIPFYRGGRTRFLYVVTNTLREGRAAKGFWDTTRLGPGDYIVRVRAADVRGNVALENRDLPVTIVRARPAGTGHYDADGR
jgi:sugar lactone lactonase YvrE